MRIGVLDSKLGRRWKAANSVPDLHSISQPWSLYKVEMFIIHGSISSCSPCVELSATLRTFQQQPTTWVSISGDNLKRVSPLVSRWKTDLRGHLEERGKTPWRFRSDWVKKKSDKDRDSDGNLELTPISGRVRQKSKQHLSWQI